MFVATCQGAHPSKVKIRHSGFEVPEGIPFFQRLTKYEKASRATSCDPPAKH